MKLCYWSLLALWLNVAACDGQPAQEKENAEATPTPAPTQSNRSGEAETPAMPYRLYGVLDPDRGNEVAFALKIPRDWQAQQRFTRKWEGATSQPQIYLRFVSPDGNSQIEYLPAARFFYARGPMAEKMRAQKRSFGMPEQMAPNELPPMNPVPFIHQKLLPYLAQNGLTISDLHNEQTAPEKRRADGQVEMRGSIDGSLPNGHAVRIEVRLLVSSQQMGSDLYYGWTAVPSITQTGGDLEAVHRHTLVAQDSIIHNPAWMRQEQEAQSRGMQVNSNAATAAMTRQHERNMAAIRNFGAANTARFNQRMHQMDQNKAAFDRHMADMDRQQEIRVDTIRGVSKFQDPSTGERMKLEDGYNHYYRDQQSGNVYYGTNTPLDSSQINWQELQKVEQKDY